MHVRPATLADLDALLALERRCFPPEEAYEPRMYLAMLTDPATLNLAHERDGRIAVFGSAITPRRGFAHVVTVNVDPDARRRGLGRSMLRELEVRAAALGASGVRLEVGVANAPAIALYESEGYARVARIRGYYAGATEPDAWRYEKPF